MRRSRLILATAATAGAALVAKRTLDRQVAAWATNHDTCEGDPTTLPEGTTIEVEASDGARLRGLACGEGPLVVLVHCWTGDSTFWAPVVRRLVDTGFRVVVLDQRGHGRSERGTDPYRPETLADDLRTWFEHHDLDDAVLAGHSMGGLASMAFFGDHTEIAHARVRALVLVATLATTPRDPRLPDFVPHTDLSRYLPLVVRIMAPADYGLLALRGVFGSRPARCQLEATRTGFLQTDAATRFEAARMMMDFDLRPTLESIAVPTTVLAGSNDMLTPLSLNEEIAHTIPEARLDVLPGLGHMLPFEAPDQVTEAIVQAAKAGAPS